MYKRRKEYKRLWIKRKRDKCQKKREATVIVSSSSDEQSPAPNSCHVAALVSSDKVREPEIDQRSSVTPSQINLLPNHEPFVLPACADNLSTNYDSSESDNEEGNKLRNNLINWVNAHQIKHNAVDELLKILKQNGHPDLCSTSRTLMSTPRSITITVKSAMEYYYFNILHQIVSIVHMYSTAKETNNLDVLDLSINIDGLPVFSSTKSSFWPVLACITNITPQIVFPVAICYGASKPSNLDFLSDTIEHILLAINEGLEVHGKFYSVRLQSIVCDAPARSFVKATKLFSGYHGCDKCMQRGLWCGRMTYPEVENFIERTDDSFRRQTNIQHHHSVSPFCSLPIDMIKAFPIDYMHQSCLGVMKKMLIAWIRGPRNFRLSFSQCSKISSRLVELKPCIPRCFARKPRTLTELDRWKATEFRQFLLYTGKIVLKDILCESRYKHFLCLSVGINILVSPELASSHIAFAHSLLVQFVSQCKVLYGDEFLVYNVHCLLHLANEAQLFGSLDRCSAFKFENYMQTIKKYVRSGKNPTVQVVKRLYESEPTITVRNPVKQVYMKSPDNAYLLCLRNGKTNGIVVLAEASSDCVKCKIFDNLHTLFDSPCKSSLIGAYKGNVNRYYVKCIPKSKLTSSWKAICCKTLSTIVFLAVLHEI
uniref:Transposase domain-containing protein n=1 Tax=Ciona intestinalis TaxID=7719 RepID=A0JPR6_CIOIN|nr:TPA: transposase domain-containing protein [Ciona intestinalis]